MINDKEKCRHIGTGTPAWNCATAKSKKRAWRANKFMKKRCLVKRGLLFEKTVLQETTPRWTEAHLGVVQMSPGESPGPFLR